MSSVASNRRPNNLADRIAALRGRGAARLVPVASMHGRTRLTWTADRSLWPAAPVSWLSRLPRDATPLH